MVKHRIRDLFNTYDRSIYQVVSEVLEIEQKYISMKRPPGIRGEIDEVVTRVAEQEIERSRQAEE